MIKNFKYFGSIVSFMVLAGCVTQPQVRVVQLDSKFDANEATLALHEGPNLIKGSALLRQQSGVVVTCAGYEVGLVPVTKYATERFRVIYGASEDGYIPIAGASSLQFQPDEPQYRTLTIKSRCDAQGFFKFDKLKDGEYYVTTRVIWNVPQSAYSNSVQGGFLSQKVAVRGGETKEIVLTAR